MPSPSARRSAGWRQRAAEALAQLYANLTPWQKALVARHPSRPHFSDYAARLFEDFTPLAGDRKFSEDEAILGGFAPLPRPGGLPDGP
jgi:acetyl-CoA carboxylase carboxyl transferase subunit alpha